MSTVSVIDGPLSIVALVQAALNLGIVKGRRLDSEVRSAQGSRPDIAAVIHNSRRDSIGPLAAHDPPYAAWSGWQRGQGPS